MTHATWLAALRARHPIPELPDPAPIDPRFWEARHRWAEAEAVGMWVQRVAR